ncbi:ion transporter [Candidatus Woesearchaeota archaeon]|nr:ion transporter [Candidatus Woesearchaeota archaeon]
MKLHKIDNLFHKLVIIFLSLSIITTAIELLAQTTEKTRYIFDIIDLIIVVFFIIDLVFEYHKRKNLKRFLKTCWPDILAIITYSPYLRLFKIARVFRPLLEAEEIVIQGRES